MQVTRERNPHNNLLAELWLSGRFLEVHEQSEGVAYLRERGAADVALGADDSRRRDVADVLTLRRRVVVEAVVVVGGDGGFGRVAADGSGERHDLHDAGGAREDTLCGHRHRWASQTGF